MESFPNLPNGLASLSDQDIQSVLGDVKQENSSNQTQSNAYSKIPSSQHSTLPHNPTNLTSFNPTYPYPTNYPYPAHNPGYPTGFNQYTYQPTLNQPTTAPPPPISQSNFPQQINSNQFQSGLPSHSPYQSSTQNTQLQDFLSNQYS